MVVRAQLPMGSQRRARRCVHFSWSRCWLALLIQDVLQSRPAELLPIQREILYIHIECGLTENPSTIRSGSHLLTPFRRTSALLQPLLSQSLLPKLRVGIGKKILILHWLSSFRE